MNLAAGQRLLHYTLTEPIGEGGMGVVWQATDTTLDRDVAIKVLPQAFAVDTERRARFEREAKVLASLNHPNIAGIYGMHECDGVFFLAMELVPGEDLAQRLQRGKLSIDETRDVGKQIAEALEAAHEQGIVHRDLKPANVKLDAEGRVKVLDFGLAKAQEASPSGDPSASPTVTSAGSIAGAILGTAAYMSPEQARGIEVCKRADIWAYGALLYELCSGKRAFPGETISDVLASVLKTEPDWVGVPKSLQPLLRRCLTKDVKQRLRDIGEARIWFDTPVEEPAPVKPASRTGWWVATIVVGVALFLLGRMLSPSQEVEVNPHDTQFLRQMTFGDGLDHEPALSPDGNYLAYTTENNGSFDIVVHPLRGGTPTIVVDHPADDAQPAWSPDGSRLAFVSARDRTGRLSVIGNLSVASPYVFGRGGSIFVMPALGGTPVKIVESGAYPAWSPDGKQLVYQSDESGRWEIYVVDVDGGEPRRIAATTDVNMQPDWSPDGRFIVFASSDSGSLFLRVVEATGGEPVVAYRGGSFCFRPRWSADGRWVYFSSDDAAAENSLNLWRARFDPATRTLSDAQRVTLSASSDIGVVMGARGDRLAFSQARFVPDIWEYDMASGATRAVTDTISSEDYPHAHPDGDRIAVDTNRGTEGRSIWTIDLEGNFLESLSVTDSIEEFTPRWSPDGTRLAYQFVTENRTGIAFREIGKAGKTDVVSIDTGDGLGPYAPVWSRDGKMIAWSVRRSDDVSVWVAEIGGEPQKLTDGTTLDAFPTFSPDGTQIAFHSEITGSRQIRVVPTEGGESEPITHDDVEYSHPVWSPVDPNTILVVVEHEDLGLVDVSTGEVRRITDFAAPTKMVDYPTWSADGTKIYFSYYQAQGNVFVLETPELK